MNKLKNKVFCVIFTILSIFLISILIIFNYQDYASESKSIEDNLIRMNGNAQGDPKQDHSIEPMGEMKNSTQETTDNNNSTNNENQTDTSLPEPKIIMDNIVYTIILNENNEIQTIINHSQNDVEEEQIKEIAESIINDSNKKEKSIGNLYFDEYSYSFNNNTLTIIDNSKAKAKLTATLNTSLLIFVLLELVILLIANYLTKWIIKPVIESFDKQKQFVADASHELKTPLAVIIANAETLEKEPEEKKWLNNIKSEADRMNNLVSDLLDMAKLESGAREQYNEEDLSKVVERTILTFESLIYEKNIKLDYQIQEGINLYCNANQIKQLVVILIDNAIKHSLNENGEIIVTLKKEKNVILEVKNKGKEIPKEEQEKIFERFYRIDESRNRNENRYGLGLAIAKNIVENHNGKISANSMNGYTTFKVIFKI